MDEGGKGMETTLRCVEGVGDGYGCGVLVGRRSIVREAKALVGKAIMEIREYESRQRKPS